jgi:hypothetical protein
VPPPDEALECKANDEEDEVEEATSRLLLMSRVADVSKSTSLSNGTLHTSDANKMPACPFSEYGYAFRAACICGKKEDRKREAMSATNLPPPHERYVR